jgi:hypothetical protein
MSIKYYIYFTIYDFLISFLSRRKAERGNQTMSSSYPVKYLKLSGLGFLSITSYSNSTTFAERVCRLAAHHVAKT